MVVIGVCFLHYLFKSPAGKGFCSKKYAFECSKKIVQFFNTMENILKTMYKYKAA